LHYEFFNAGPVNIEGYRAFEVQLASSGRIVVVPPGQTVVQALLAAGVEIPTSCEQGVCGTSITRGTSKKARSPQRPFHARGAQCQRSVHAVLLAREVGAACAGPVGVDIAIRLDGGMRAGEFQLCERGT
jgi:hypothetical protein